MTIVSDINNNNKLIKRPYVPSTGNGKWEMGDSKKWVQQGHNKHWELVVDIFGNQKIG